MVIEPLPFDVDAVNAMLRAEFSGIGTLCAELGEGYAIAARDITPLDIRPGGFVSGAIQFGVIDAALWFLAFVGLRRIEPMAMTSELSIRYLRPAQGQRLYCRADLESVSRRSVVGTAHVWCDDQTGRITSTAQGTYAIPLPR